MYPELSQWTPGYAQHYDRRTEQTAAYYVSCYHVNTCIYVNSCTRVYLSMHAGMYSNTVPGEHAQPCRYAANTVPSEVLRKSNISDTCPVGYARIYCKFQALQHLTVQIRTFRTFPIQQVEGLAYRSYSGEQTHFKVQ